MLPWNHNGSLGPTFTDSIAKAFRINILHGGRYCVWMGILCKGATRGSHPPSILADHPARSFAVFPSDLVACMYLPKESSDSDRTNILPKLEQAESFDCC